MMARMFLPLLIFFAPGCAMLGPMNPMSPVERKLLYHPTNLASIPAATDFESIQFQSNSGHEHPEAKGGLLFCRGYANCHRTINSVCSASTIAVTA